MNKTRVKQISFFVEVINSLNDKYRGSKRTLVTWYKFMFAVRRKCDPKFL